jgi:23S rRNA pseudouridine1911/1915/1917 synthase
MEKREIVIDSRHEGGRLDKALASYVPELSRTFLQKLIKDGLLELNGSVCDSPRRAVAAGDKISVSVPEPETQKPLPENIDLPVLFEDESLIVINKPAGMTVHPGGGAKSGTVVNALLGMEPELGDVFGEDEMRPGIVHRLDKDTSGCLLLAKNPQSLFALSKAFAERRVGKVYAALLSGHPMFTTKKVDAPIGRHPIDRKKMAVMPERGRDAASVFTIVSRGLIDGNQVSLAHIKILTGRTHQIRVHAAFIKNPVLGDTVYGGKAGALAPRQMLHAWRLSLPHPATGKEISFECPFPDDFQKLLARMGGG